MATLSKFDFLIVGQGIAGTMLAHFLLKANRTFLVVDNNHLQSSSLVGAGIMNPVTGRRLVKSWMADELVPAAKKTYSEIESLHGDKFLHELPIYKLFANTGEQNDWSTKEHLPEYAPYISSYSIDKISDFFHIEYGGFSIAGGGYVDMTKLVTTYRKLLAEQGLLFDQPFDYKIELAENKVSWNGLEFSKIIFAEGVAINQNPYFKWLPFKLAKGEILTVKIPGLSLDCIINKNIFILPLADGLFRVGATYVWDFENAEPTEAARHDLTERLRSTIKLPFEVVDHVAGIRPTNVDRRPYLGVHPKFKQLAVFNGFGTKAVALSPYFANELVEFLLHKERLNPEVDIIRFRELCT